MAINKLSKEELRSDSIKTIRLNRDKNNPDDIRYFNADGFCSAYGHACGYGDSFRLGIVELNMYYEMACYEVRLLVDSYKLEFTFPTWEPLARELAKHKFKFIRKVCLYEYHKGSRHLIAPRLKGDTEKSYEYFKAIC